jgi:putative N6-adenine-specific DNA methylase
MSRYRYQYQETRVFFAQTQRLLEPVAREELEELGAQQCKESFCGVYFEASPSLLPRVLYLARTINRVLAPLVTFSCPSEERLYRTAYDFPWFDLFGLSKSFAVFCNVSDSQIKHSRFAALRLKDAIADHFRKKYGKRPNVDPKEPDVRFNLKIQEDRAVISLDLSGQSLHRRGYRTASVIAPVQETLAAAIVRLSGWQGEKPLLDPMAGSGTILAEALMKYSRIPAGFKRHTFGFAHLPDFDPKAWEKIKRECDAKIHPCPQRLIKGSDSDHSAVDAALKNLKQIPGGSQIPIHCLDFRDLQGTEDHVIITNPPYGVRLDHGEQEKLQELYRQLGDFLKKQCRGSTAYILCGDKELSKHIGLKVSRRIPLYNGPIETRLVKIEVY